MRIIAVVNQKGGVGKTTTVQNLGAGLTHRGRRVLLVDMDPQGNLTEACGLDPKTLETSVNDVLVSEVSLKDIVHKVADRLDVAPANVNLSAAEVTLLDMDEPGRRLINALNRARVRDRYDYVLIDCPPSLGQLTVNALVAAREIIIPIQTEFYALRGLTKLMNTIEAVKEHAGNRKLAVTGMVATMFDGRKNLSREILAQLDKHYRDVLFKTPVRDNVALGEAPVIGQDIFTYRPSSHGAEDYAAVAEEVIKQEVS